MLIFNSTILFFFSFGMCLSYIVVLNILYIYFIGTYRQRDTDQGTRPTTVCEAANTIEATVHIMISIFFNDTEKCV